MTSTQLEGKVATGTVTVSPVALLELLSGAATHAGTDKSLPVLNAVAIEGKGEEIIARATDRYRVIEGSVKGEESGSMPLTLIPLAEIKNILALIKSSKHGYVTITREEERVTVRHLDREITFRAYEGTFPPTDHLFPSEDTPRVSVEKIAFNPSFFADYGKIVGKKGAVTVEFTDNNSPMRKPIIIGLAGEKVTWRALLMPMRIA